MISIATVDQESQDLDLHVQLCAQRYKDLDSRLTSLEVKTDQILAEIRQNKTEMTKIMIGTAGTVIASVLALIVTVLIKF